MGRNCLVAFIPVFSRFVCILDFPNTSFLFYSEGDGVVYAMSRVQETETVRNDINASELENSETQLLT